MSTYTDASLIVTPNAKKAGKLYALKGADLDVVRATTATYVGSDGLIKTALANEVRFDYTNGSCPSILVEPQRTNLLLRSEEFDNASWGKVNLTITANQTTAPDGNLTADLLAGIGTGASYSYQNATVVSGQTYTISIFAKKNQTKFLQIFGGSDFSVSKWANFDLENGIVGTTGVGTIASITPYDDGWYRCSIQTSNTSGTIGGSFFVPINSATASRNPSFNATNHSIYIWGAQLEAGANATSYIPTVASSVTRNADVISKTGLSGITTITETFENETTNVISGSPTSYTMSQGRIKHVIGL